MRKALWLFFSPQLLLWGLYVVLMHLLHPKTVEILLFYTAQALLVFLYGKYAVQKKRKLSVLLTEVMCFRLSTSLIYVAFVLWIGTPLPIVFVLYVAVLYLLYLLFELFFFFYTFAQAAKEEGTTKGNQ